MSNAFDEPAAGRASANPFDETKGAAKNPFDEGGAKGSKPKASAVDKFEAIAGAPQRALQAFETGDDIGHAFMHPEDAKRLSGQVKQNIGLTDLEKTGPLAGDDIFHKTARGVADTALDVVNDPLTFLPVGKIAKFGAKLIPGAEKAVEAGRSAIEGSKVGEWLAPEYKARHLTDEGRAAVSLAEHQGEDAARTVREKAMQTVRQHASAIRAGQMPDEVQGLFRDRANIPQAAAGLKPQDVLQAAYKDADLLKHEVYTKALKDAGLTGEGGDHMSRAFPESSSARYFKDPSKVAEAQAALLEPVKKATNPILDVARKLTHAGNKAFLGVPIPHILNLTALSFLKYGVPTTLKGLMNGVAVATGHEGPQLAKDIEELRSLHGDSKYGAVFDELGLTKLFGSEKAAGAFNAVTKPLQRASNALQNTTLNPAETGLRAAALNAEKRAGKEGAGAVRDIHSTFGTDASNQLTRTASDMAQPFAKFHLQTALGGGAVAMAKHPGRIQAMAHEDQDMNAQGGPAAFHLNVPGMSTMRAVTDPIGYGASAFGPIGQFAGPYSPATLLRESYQGFQAGNQKLGLKKASQAMSEVAGRFVPENEALLALSRMAMGKKGQAGEDPLADLASSIVTGGFFQKQAAR